MANLLWVIRTGKRGEPKTFRLSAVYNLPDVEAHIPFDLILVNVKEGIPVFLENLFECERGFGDSFHNGLES